MNQLDDAQNALRGFKTELTDVTIQANMQVTVETASYYSCRF